MGIMAGSLPTLKPLFKQVLGSYASRSKTRAYTYGSKPYRLHSLSQSGHQRSQTLRSANQSGWEPEADQKRPHQASREFVTTTTTTTSYPQIGSSNSSEEYILSSRDPDAITLTTEVLVSRSPGAWPERNQPGAHSAGGRFGQADMA